jgi:hypothetical protein
LFSRTFSLTTRAASLTITTPSLAAGIRDSAYFQQFQAAGGTAPYQWTAAAGVLPAGLSLSDAGILSGIPTATGSNNVLINVTDARGTTISQAFAIAVFPPPGSLSISNVPVSLNPAQQTVFGLSLSSPHPSTLVGQLRLSFTPNAAFSGDDPMVQFSNGSRTVNFEIPANTTNAVFPLPVMLLTGTVAGTIRMNASIQNGPTNVPTGTVDILPAAPHITSLEAFQTSAGIEIRVTAYSSVRTVTTVGFAFDLRTNSGLQRVNLSRSVEDDFAAWYQNSVSATFGSAFVFTQFFNVQGDGSGIDSVSVTLTNPQGTTSSGPVRLLQR